MPIYNLSIIPLVIVSLLLKVILYAAAFLILSDLDYVASISYPLFWGLIVADVISVGLYFIQKRRSLRGSMFLLYCQLCTLLGFAILATMQVATYILKL